MNPQPHAPFLLITGCPRSGTTLLASEMEKRFDVAVPFETHFVPIFARWLWLYGDLGKPVNRRRMLQDIYLFSEMWINTLKTAERGFVRENSILATASRADYIVETSHDYMSLCRAIFDAYATHAGAGRVLDKSVYMRAISLDRLDTVLGGIRVINVVRDGRDVFLSARRTWFGMTSVSQFARLWKGHVCSAIDYARHHPQAVMTVRYEDLLSEPEDIFNAIRDFLGLSPAMSERSTGLGAALSRVSEHRMLDQPINVDNKNKYTREMSMRANILFQVLAGDELAGMGYDTDPDSVQAHAGLGMWGFHVQDWLSGLPRRLILWPQHVVKWGLPFLFICGLRPVCRNLIKEPRQGGG